MKNLALYLVSFNIVLSLAKELMGTLIMVLDNDEPDKYFYVDYQALLECKERSTLSCIYTFIHGITKQDSVFVLDQNQSAVSELVWDYDKKTYIEQEF